MLKASEQISQWGGKEDAGIPNHFATILRIRREGGGAPLSVTLPAPVLMRTSGIEPHKQRRRKNVDLRSEQVLEKGTKVSIPTITPLSPHHRSQHHSSKPCF